ncbi:MAG: rhodanese-like domain-containing protein [Parahaliea sp.]
MALFLEFLAQQWILAAALLVAVALLIAHESRKAGPALSPQQAINLINGEGGIFLDVRDAADYKRGHITDAVNMPVSKVDTHIGELEKYKSSPIVVVCKMGQHAGAVGRKLQAQGFEKTYKMRGGMMEWGSLQLPTAR